MGANIDAVATAESMGIHRDQATNFVADADGTKLNYLAMNEAVVNYRKNKKMDANWKASIEEDFKKRSKK